jgi:hypothetical protein
MSASAVSSMWVFIMTALIPPVVKLIGPCAHAPAPGLAGSLKQARHPVPTRLRRTSHGRPTGGAARSALERYAYPGLTLLFAA